VRTRVFTIDGTAVHDLVVSTIPAGREPVFPSIAFDLNGNFVVVWGSVSGPFSNTSGNVWAQAYDPSGAPVREARSLQTGPVREGVSAVERRTDGGFMAFWQEDFDWHAGVRFTLCAPGSAVCGDGVQSSTCEVCDDRAGNSDTLPDACRTDCRPARCGDGVADAGEPCDDGNDFYCDGCTPTCQLEVGTVCGDGILAPAGCSEHCDDANAVAGDGCASTCTVERIVGGGSIASDCWAAWRMENTSNVPLYDSRGRINRKQRCRDGDPACDFDAIAGQCTFHVAVCVNNSEPAGCEPVRLLSWSVRKPSAKQAAAQPVLATLRSALTTAVVPNVVGAGTPNLCSPYADVTLPLKGSPGAYKASKLALGADGTSYDGLIDGDTLALRCDPAS
jgi:cysteine-rich repeat protein